MKESKLKGHRKYSNIPFIKIKNHIEKDGSIYVMPHEIQWCVGYFEYDEMDISNLPFIKFNNEVALERFLTHRKNRKESLYFVLKELVKAYLKGDKYIKKITILSSTFRYVFRHEVTEKYDLFNKLMMAFKTLSTYKLHCMCSCTIIKNGIVIWVHHSPYQEKESKKHEKQ